MSIATTSTTQPPHTELGRAARPDSDQTRFGEVLAGCGRPTLLAEQEIKEANNEPTDAPLRLQHPTKGLRWLRHRTRARRLADGQSRIYGLVSDVTDEHRQALELGRARDLAEAASQAKSHPWPI